MITHSNNKTITHTLTNSHTHRHKTYIDARKTLMQKQSKIHKKINTLSKTKKETYIDSKL